MTKRSVVRWAICSAVFLGPLTTVACGSDATSNATGADEAGAPAPDGGTVLIEDAAAGDAGPTVTSSDGGTIDSGLDPADFTVCGGSKGDPGAVPLLDWSALAFRTKYAVILGATAPTTEPLVFSSTLVMASGTNSEDTTTFSNATTGFGPFHTISGVSKDAFASKVMPETKVASTSEKDLGWSGMIGLYYDLATIHAVEGWKDYRTAYHAAWVSPRSWSLLSPVRASDEPLSDYYVGAFSATHGQGFLFTIVFDDPCKTAAFDRLVGGNTLDVLTVTSTRTRAAVSKFLVQNNAHLFLRVLTFGRLNPAVTAALQGTRASAATLDALEATLTAVDTALNHDFDDLGTPDYASVAAGTNPNWVTGEVHAYPVSDLH